MRKILKKRARERGRKRAPLGLTAFVLWVQGPIVSVNGLDKMQTRNVPVPKRNTTIIWTPKLMVGWYVGRCGSKDCQREDMCFKGIGLRALNMLFIVGSMESMNMGVYMTT